MPHAPGSNDSKPSATPGALLEDRGRVAVLIVLLLAPFVVFPASFVPRALLDGGDDLLANLPELVYSARKLLAGEVLWMPELWMGHPLLGEPEFATFYLPKLLLLVGPPVVVYAAYVVLHFLAAELGAYLYLKRLGMGRVASVFGALAYAYTGFMLGHRAHTMYVCAGAWAPFVLLLFDRAEDDGARWTYLAAALAFSMVPFSGAVQLAVYLGGLLVALAATRSFMERRARPLVTTASCLVPGLLVSSAQILPSRHLAEQLATNLRDDYALSVMHSFHPALLPTLALPIPPLDAELYSRAGAAVLAGALVSLFAIRTAPVRVRAWAVVPGVALVLMLGRYVPPVAHALQGLPVVGVLRGPARHNFELGLSLSVLGAYGVHVAQRAYLPRPGAWLAGGALFAGLVYAAVRLAAGGNVDDAASASLLGGVTPGAALCAAASFGVFVAALGFRRSAHAKTLWAAVALLPLLEAAWALRVEARPNRTAVGLVEAARAALPEPGTHVRLLSVSLHRGSVDALAGNSILLHPGVESLQGYSSIVYRDARQLLELDMHGQPSFYDELALSILPSVFGVTHVVLPNLACGDTRAELARPGELCARAAAHSPPERFPVLSAHGRFGCSALVTDSTWAYRLELTASAEAVEPVGTSFAFHGGLVWDRRFGLDVPGPWLGREPATRGSSVRLGDGESWGLLLFDNPRRSRLTVEAALLRAERDVAVATLGALDPPEGAPPGSTAPSALRLAAGADPALRHVHWPRAGRPRTAVLTVEARVPSPGPRQLVVDLYAANGYDPEDAQLVILGPELGPEWKSFVRTIPVDGAPDDFDLRAFASGDGAVELREARLADHFDETVLDALSSAVPRVTKARVEGGRATLEPGGRVGDVTHLPVRAFEVLLDAEAPGGLGGPVRFGFDTEARYEEPRTWDIDPAAFGARARVHHLTVLPPDAREPSLFVDVPGGPPLAVHELSAVDACALRGYRNPRKLGNGLFLYENPLAAPRAYTVARTSRAIDPVTVRRELLEFLPSDLGTKAVVQTDLPPTLAGGQVVRAEFGQRSTDVLVRADGGPTLLVVNERFDPDWVASIDGAPATIIPVNGLVRGVVVPEGRHRVHMEYRAPAAVWIGAVLAVLGAVLAVLAGWRMAGAGRAQNSV